jgi:site-specific DNA recombinase
MRQEPAEKAKSVGIWIRVSTEDQARGDSPEHHEKRACAYAEAKDWHVVETYRLDAVSGKAVMAHPEAQRMLQDVRSGAITGLVFSKLARLARNTRELLEFAEIFRGCGADLVSLQEAIDTSSPAGRLFFTMIAAMAQWEREEIADRVAATVPIRAKLGKPIGGAAPYGFRWENKQLVIDPEEAPVRRLMFELFAEHQRKRTVARILNERGYRTRSGESWSGTSVRRLLEDTTAKGSHRRNYTYSTDNKKAWQLKPESEWVVVPVEPIVSLELWERCAAILEGQRARVKPVARRAVHLFAGIAHCACGTRMYVRAGSPKYICEGCRNKIPTGDLEAVFLSELRRFLVTPAEIEAHARAAGEAVREKERLIEKTNAELHKVEVDEARVFELHRSGQIATMDFGRHHRPISERRYQLEDELPRLQAELDVMRISLASQEEAFIGARTVTERWPSLTPLEKRQMVEATTSRITIGKDEIAIDLLYLPVESSDHNATQSHSCVALWRLPVPVVLRVWGVLSTPAFERMFAQPSNKIDVFEATRSGKIVLVSTAKDLLKSDGSALLGRFFIRMLAQAALERSVLGEWERTPTFVYVDEAQEYFDDGVEAILQQARKYRIALVAAHQSLDQASPRLRSALFANTSFKCAGGVSAKDARALADELHTSADFIGSMTRRGGRTEFAAWIKNWTAGAVRLSVPLGFLERQPTLSEEQLDEVIARNRIRYCGTLEEVRQALAPRVPALPTPSTEEAGDSTPEATAATQPEVIREETDDPSLRAPGRIAEPYVPSPASRSAERELGKGGKKHRYLQNLVKGLAEQQGFRATIEAPMAGGQVDVLLERDGETIAIEVSVTTPVEWERQNLHRCLAEPFSRVALVLAKSQQTAKSYREAVMAGLTPDELARLSILYPDDLPDFIGSLAPSPEPDANIVKGYRVRVSRTDVSPEEAKARRETLARLVGESLRRQRSEED